MRASGATRRRWRLIIRAPCPRRARCPGCAARDSRTRRAPPDDDRDVRELGGAQVLDDGAPGRVELVGRRGRAAPGDAVGLLDERHGGATGWLEAHGFGADEQAALRARLRD